MKNQELFTSNICAEIKSTESLNIDLKKWVNDTEDFSIAHLKELFVAVVILGDEYEEAIENLSQMKENITSREDEDKSIGFGPAMKKRKRLTDYGMEKESN